MWVYKGVSCIAFSLSCILSRSLEGDMGCLSNKVRLCPMTASATRSHCSSGQDRDLHSCLIWCYFRAVSEWAQGRSTSVQMVYSNEIWVLFQVSSWKTSWGPSYIGLQWAELSSCPFQMEFLSPESYHRLVATSKWDLLQHTLTAYLLCSSALMKVVPLLLRKINS